MTRLELVHINLYYYYKFLLNKYDAKIIGIKTKTDPKVLNNGTERKDSEKVNDNIMMMELVIFA